MKYFLGVVVSLILANLSMVSDAGASSVNNFTITNFDIQYSLSRNEEGRSVLKTTETITADFPYSNQNHGLERAMPRSYDGHNTRVKVESVKSKAGGPLPYTTYDSNDNLVLRIGDKNKYVQGSMTYVVTYSQQDVTRFFANTNRDEFYWDTNGTEWNVPIEKLSVSLQLNNELQASLTGDVACYYGRSGSSKTCEIRRDATGLYATVSNLSARENATIAVGFKPNTFSVYKMSVQERLMVLYIGVLIAGSIIAVISIIWLSIRWYVWSDRTKEIGSIVPEYIPPKDSSVTTSASIGSTQGATFTAQLLDFAVRHYIKIYQTRDKGFLRPAEYDIEIVKDIKSLKEEEQEIITDIFDGKVTVGTRLALKSLQNNTKLYTRVKDNDTKLRSLVRGEYALRHQVPNQSAWFKKRGWILLIVAVICLNPLLLIAAIVAFSLGHTLWPLTDKGLALSRYLKGLKMYIEVAETERIKMLQSPEGAQKVSDVNVSDSAQLVKLYERVLPYAVLFGQEKEWNKQIGQYYEKMGTGPEWYGGSNAVFNAAIFSSAMSSFSTAASYSSASSSSSGGSGGGGSSGGGGGGGGGGGW